MIDLDKMASAIRDWQDEQFGCNKIEAALAMCEEAGELARAVLKAKQGIRPETRGNVGEEIGDVIMTAMALADRYGLSVDTCLRDRFKRMKTLNFDGRAEEA